MMDKEQLRAQMEHLHAELRQASTLGPEQREMLQARADDIEELLKREEIKPHHYRSLHERLSEDVAELEASHPEITLLMRHMIDSLAFLGI